MKKLRIVIPCHNEEAEIRGCLSAVHAACQEIPSEVFSEIVVVANGCTDGAARNAHDVLRSVFGGVVKWQILSLDTRSKANALNIGAPRDFDGMVVVIDADVRLGQSCLRELVACLDRPEPTFASGSIVVVSSRDPVVSCYAKVWQNLDFVRNSAPGCGLYAFNAAGR